MKCIEDDIPFELPEGWEWCNLGIITDVCGRIGFRGYTKNDLVEKGKGAITLSPSNIIDNKMDYSSCTYISWEKYEESPEIMIQNNDILLVKTGSSYGKSAFVENLPEKATINPQFVVLKETRINPQFLCYFLQSNYAKVKFDKLVVGTAIPTFSQANLNAMYIAFPGINEQKKIVNKIVELLKYIDVVNDEKECLQSAILQTKSKILDLAIRGKLVPQDPNDEPASVLLERIRAEKEELIKQGKIKRDKKESIIFRGDDNSYYQKVGEEIIDISDELPFDIPYSWCWGELKDILIINPRNKLEDDMEVAFIPMPMIEDGYSGNHTFEIRKWKDIKNGFTHFKDGDVGIAKITPCFENRKSVVFRNLCNGYGAGTTELHVLRPYRDTILPEYLLIYAKTQRFIEDGKQAFSGAVGQQRIGKEYIETVYFPIPPLREQQRIIKHINDLFNYLNVVENALS